MSRQAKKPYHVLLKDQAARILVAATYEFLRRNKVSAEVMQLFRVPNRIRAGYQSNLRSYQKLMQSYEHMGVLIATWCSDPTFLDESGNPLALSTSGSLSISKLIRLSKVPIPKRLAIELLRCSPSVKCRDDGQFIPLRKVFVLPEFEVPRASLVVERFLDTLNRNASGRKLKSTLLERSCHATMVDIKRVAPILRDIKERGSAFMDSIDGEIEACRSEKSTENTLGELGVAVFAWTKAS